MQKASSFQLIFLFLLQCCNAYAQNILGGPCEDCEAIYEYGDRTLSFVDTLPGFHEQESKLMIEGTVFESDGSSPAEGVVLYVYHTNREGIYETKRGGTGWARRHGYLRGWMKTGADGYYRFYSFRPAPYPDGREPEHIHIYVKEADKKEYYLDNFYFHDDPMLTAEEIATHDKRGGSGITTLRDKNGILTGRRNIILGKNIPNYSK